MIKTKIKTLNIFLIILIKMKIAFQKLLYYLQDLILKNKINANLNGIYSSAFVNGIFSLINNQYNEIRTTINHLIENTKAIS